MTVALVGCTKGIELGSDLQLGAAGRDSMSNAGQGPSTALCEVRRCDGKIYACGDCVDNDADGQTDSEDLECLGACDDTEDSFASGITGKSDGSCKLDCYFDGDNGSGNDGCHWSARCDPLSASPDYPPSGDAQCSYDPSATVPGTDLSCGALQTEQSSACLSACLPLTPEGCDCFGCCEIPKGTAQYVWLGSTVEGVASCDDSSLSDPVRCRPCTPVSGCRN